MMFIHGIPFIRNRHGISNSLQLRHPPIGLVASWIRLQCFKPVLAVAGQFVRFIEVNFIVADIVKIAG